MFMQDVLTTAGLTDTQAAVYIFLLENGESSPPAIARKLSLTRTNAYKILDNLIELGLVRKTEINKKFVYMAEDPIALTAIVTAERNRVISMENSVRDAMHQLRASYEKMQKDYDVRVFRGNAAISALYLSQAKQGEPIYAIKSPADAATLGTEAASHIRQLPHKSGAKIHEIDSTDLDSYTSPVEWSVSGEELLLIDFQQEAAAIRIKNPAIAKAFIEMWRILYKSK